MTRILVIGGSRGIGLEVCRQALAGDHFVRAMSRNGRLPQRVGPHCEAFKGDARNPEDVVRALRGIDVVVQALGVPQSLDFILKPVTLFSEATAVMLSAMKEAGVSKLAAVTGFGAGDSREAVNILQRLPFNMIFKKAYDDKSIQEALIAESGLDWLIVRPGVLMNWSTIGRYKVLTRPREWRNGVVGRVDVADFILKRIDRDALNHQKPVIIRCPL